MPIFRRVSLDFKMHVYFVTSSNFAGHLSEGSGVRLGNKHSVPYVTQNCEGANQSRLRWDLLTTMWC